MINSRFYTKSNPYKLSEVIKLIDKDLISPPDNYEDLLINDVKSLKEAGSGDISFLSNIKYLQQLQNTKASCCIVLDNIQEDPSNKVILLKTKNPYFVYTKLIDLFYKRAKSYPNKIMPTAYVSSSAIIGANCYIGHNVVIEDNVQIGDDSIIESGSFIDHGVVIGKRAMVCSNVSISYSLIGDDVVILSGARIGQDGFGFATDKGVHKKIFHTGIVKIGDNVEIGSNTTIDRGSLNDTIIEDLARIDNLVQIGHNVTIGKGTVVVAQVGVSGSTKIGAYCALGGQAGFAGHITIGDQAQVAAQAGVMKDVAPSSAVGGSPAVPIKEWLKQTVVLRQLMNKDK